MKKSAKANGTKKAPGNAVKDKAKLKPAERHRAPVRVTADQVAAAVAKVLRIELEDLGKLEITQTDPRYAERFGLPQWTMKLETIGFPT